MNSDFEFETIYNHQELQKFWYNNTFSSSYIADYQENDNKLEFLQIDQNSKHSMITVYQLVERDVDIHFPTHIW